VKNVPVLVVLVLALGGLVQDLVLDVLVQVRVGLVLALLALVLIVVVVLVLAVVGVLVIEGANVLAIGVVTVLVVVSQQGNLEREEPLALEKVVRVSGSCPHRYLHPHPHQAVQVVRVWVVMVR
jgi:hypothetical protein